MDFLQFTSGFSSIKNLAGLALFDPEGELIDSSLPFSDERATALAKPLNEMLRQCQEQGRTDNRFVIETDKGTVIYCGLGENSALLLLEGSEEVDSTLKVLAWQRTKLEEELDQELTPAPALPASGEELAPHPLSLEPQEHPSVEVTPAPATPSPVFNLADKPASTVSSTHPPARLAGSPQQPSPFQVSRPAKGRWLLPAALIFAIVLSIVYIAQRPVDPPIAKPLEAIESTPAPSSSSLASAPAPNSAPTQPEEEMTDLILRGNFPLNSELMTGVISAFIAAEGLELEHTEGDEKRKVFEVSGANKVGRIILQPLDPSDPPFVDSEEKRPEFDSENLTLISSFRLQPTHFERLNRAGVDFSDPASETVIGMDAVSFVLHPDSPYRSFTPALLKEILSDGITNWSAFNQGDLPINVYVLPWHQFNTPNLGPDLFGITGTRLVRTHRTLPNISELLKAVNNDPGAIGILPRSQAPEGQRLLGVVSSVTGKVVPPGKWEISQFNYPFSHFVYAYTSPSPSETQKKFLSFLGSAAGKKALEEGGLVLPRITPDANGTDPAEQHRQPLYKGRPDDLRKFLSGYTRVESPRLYRYRQGGGVPPEELEGLVEKVGKDRSYRIVAYANSKAENTIQVGKWVEQELRKQGATDVTYFSASDRLPLYIKEDAIAPLLNNRVEIWTR